MLERVTHSTVRKCKANHNWDALTLIDADDNLIEENDFSHTSNTCIWTRTACRNLIQKNNLSYGIRIAPGEIHARDSACMLIEAGSDDNRILDNDITYGGDGVFIRAMGSWTSRGNVFEGNDASYAHNNCFEAQSPGNIYRHNKANYGSHGIWVGLSDETIIEDNEVSYNGDPKENHNAPIGLPAATFEPRVGCRRHHYPRTDEPYRLPRQQVHRQQRRRHRPVGRYGQSAQEDLPLDRRQQRRPRQSHRDLPARGGLGRHGRQRPGQPGRQPGHRPGGQQRDQAPQTIPRSHSRRTPCWPLGRPWPRWTSRWSLDASGSTDPAGKKLVFRWDFDDGSPAEFNPAVTHAFKTPGFYRVGVTVTNGRYSRPCLPQFPRRSTTFRKSAPRARPPTGTSWK